MPTNLKPVKRLLVLTSATGAGHDTHATATAAWCRRLYGTDVEVRIDHTLEKSHWFNRAGVAFYNLIQRRCPWFHHIYYNLIEVFEAMNRGQIACGKDYYIRLLDDFRPDAILSVHDCLNVGYFQVAREVLGPTVRCATFCAEFGGGYGFSRNWINPVGDEFFARTEETARTARRRMDPAKVRIVGHWAPPDFYGPDLTEEEKIADLEAWGLRPDRFTLLLATGGAGAQNHLPILRALLPWGDRLQAIALCGRSEATLRDLERWACHHRHLVVKPLPFTQEMFKLLRTVSAVVARAGATTAGEALLCGCPIIFNSMGGMMPQEIPTWRYFKAHRVEAAASRPRQVAAIVGQWLDSPEEYQSLRERLKGLRDDTTPQMALRSLLGE